MKERKVNYGHRRMRCYGMPRQWGWSTKDSIEGPCSSSEKYKFKRIMRRMARMEAKRELIVFSAEYTLLEDTLIDAPWCEVKYE